MIAGIAILARTLLPTSSLLSVAAQGTSIPVLPDLNARLHPGDSAPWTILFVLTAITLLPSLVMAITPMVRLDGGFPFSAPGAGHADRSFQSDAAGPGAGDDLVSDAAGADGGRAAGGYTLPQRTSHGAGRPSTGARSPIKTFMLRYAREKDLALFTAAGQIPRPAKPEDLPMRAVVPAYMLSELKAGFAIGAVLYLHFC
jgi:flagellar biosynthetic protein FliP